MSTTNNKYPSGLMLITRTIIHGFIIGQSNKKETIFPVSIPYRSCVALLEYVRSFNEESVSLLWDNKIIFVENVDFEHHFKILNDNNED
jgi:hypothetical protein